MYFFYMYFMYVYLYIHNTYTQCTQIYNEKNPFILDVINHDSSFDSTSKNIKNSEVAHLTDRHKNPQRAA